MEKKILIIDDEKNLAQFLQDILSELNGEGDDTYTIEKAFNATDGLNIAMDFKPDLVLLDIKLPDKSGTEVLSDLKQEDSDIQVIIMTGHASIETAVYSIREKAYDYIQKPLPTKDHLKTLVKNALERRQLLLDKKTLLLELSEANEAFEEANRVLQDEKLLVNKRLKKKFLELSRLNTFSQTLLHYNNLAGMIEDAPKKIAKTTESGGAILILKEGKDDKYVVHSTANDVSLSPGDTIKVGEGPFGLVNNKGPWETDEYICCPLSFGDEALGVLAIKKKNGISADLIATIAANLSVSLHNVMLYDTLKSSYLEAILALIMVQETVDPEIKEHSQRVSDLSLKIAENLNIPQKEKNNIRYAALLHDLGKIGQKKIDAAAASARIISPIKFLKETRNILKHLCENYDGSGKPDNLSAENIPIGSRIIRPANRVEELRSENKEKTEIINEIEQGKGTLYDPEISKTLKALL